MTQRPRVWIAALAIAGAGGSSAAVLLPALAAVDPTRQAPWWLLAIAFWLVEARVVHFHFRRGAHTFSLSEVPLVVGMFLMAPLAVVVAQAIGSTAALFVNRRQPAVKLVFNAGSFALSSTVGLLVFHLVGTGPLTDPSRWIAALLGTAVANAVGVALVAVMISLSEGGMGAEKLRRMVGVSSVIAVTNTSIALMAVLTVVADPRAALLMVIPITTLYLGYRSFISARQQNESLELLYESTRILQRTPELDSALVQLLYHARTMFRAERAEIVIFPSEPDERYFVTSVTEESSAVMAEAPTTVWQPVHREVAQQGKAFLLNASTLDLMPGGEVRDAMLAPLGNEGGTVGAMVITNRLGDVSTFTTEDLRLFSTVASHAGTALENGQLERSLTKLSMLQDELKHQAYHDGLTQLANRTLFRENVNASLAATPKGRRSVVMFIDLDDFKLVNDMHGHAVGDTMLVEVARRLGECTRSSDLAARLGGDEFAVLVGDGPELVNAKHVAERIIDAVARPFKIGEIETSISASIGIAVGSQGDLAEDLLRHADVAMYSAKSSGKGNWALFEPSMLKRVKSRHDAGAGLQRALDREEFQLLYQPVVALETGSIVGAEALVRWNHPTRGEISPDDFIGTAEENGIIVPIGRWVLGEACRVSASWTQTPDAPARWISVNLSARQLQHPALVRDVKAAITAAGLPPGRLVAEVTESVLLHDADAAISVLGELRQMGVRVALDDFGTGYSSLNYLHRFPIDMLKIAQGFVDSGDSQDRRWILAEAMVAMGKALGLQVVAEGVERRSQVQRLKATGCELAQGFYFARPLTADSLAAEFARSSAQRRGTDRITRRAAAQPTAA